MLQSPVRNIMVIYGARARAVSIINTKWRMFSGMPCQIISGTQALLRRLKFIHLGAVYFNTSAFEGIAKNHHGRRFKAVAGIKAVSAEVVCIGE